MRQFTSLLFVTAVLSSAAIGQEPAAPAAANEAAPIAANEAASVAAKETAPDAAKDGPGTPAAPSGGESTSEPKGPPPLLAGANVDPASIAALLDKLSPEGKKSFGQLLGKEWKDRPEWVEMVVDILRDEPMQPGFGWFKPTEAKYDWFWLSGRLDANSDGRVSLDEIPESFPNRENVFARMDRDFDGQLRFSDFDFFGQQQPTNPPALMSQFLTGILDVDSNGRITPDEMQSFLSRVDKEKGGFLTPEDLYRDFTRAFKDMNAPGGDDMPNGEGMLRMLFAGELGVFESGPVLGALAPDFTLPTHDGTRQVSLSGSKGRPVVLIFGSFT